MKELKIEVPEGYEIDKENSTFECIKFKPKELTYNDIAERLFLNNIHTYFLNGQGKTDVFHCFDAYTNRKNAVSERQCERLLAINMLMNVAYYFNEIVDKDSHSLVKYLPSLDDIGRITEFIVLDSYRTGLVYFKTKESFEKAIKILGEETIKLAIGL